MAAGTLYPRVRGDADAQRLSDMLVCARRVREFIGEAEYEELSHDLLRASAVEHQLHVIGEAAAHVSDARKAEHPEIPWTRLEEMRRVLSSATRVNIAAAWTWSRELVSGLIQQLEPLVPPVEEQPERANDNA